MGWATFILLGFVLGLFAAHVITVMRLAVCGFLRKVQGLKRLELDFREEEDNNEPRRLK